MAIPSNGDDYTELHDNPERLVAAVMETIHRLHTVHTRYEHSLKRAKEAERVYKLNRAKAYLKAEGTAGQREATRDVEADLDYYRFQMADGESDAMKERIVTLRGELVALQSLLATFRSEWGTASATQKYGT